MPFAARVISPAIADVAAATGVYAMAGVAEVTQDMVD